LPARPNIMESVENVHKKIEELKSLSKARVRQPVQ
jgi:hypothetical protein